MRGSRSFRKSPRPIEKKPSRLRDEVIESDPQRCPGCGLHYRISLRSDTSFSVRKFPSPTREPRVLDCGHVVCSCCIAKGQDETSASLSCPFCGALTNEPSENCPISYHNLGRIIHGTVNGGCEDSLLNNSSSFLSTSALAALDTTVLESPLDQSVEVCPKHGQPIVLKCVECINDFLICDLCTKPGGRHFEHHVGKLEPVNQETNICFDVAKAVEKVTVQKLAEKRRLKAQITRYFDSFHGKLTLSEHKSLQKIETIYDDYFAKITQENFSDVDQVEVALAQPIAEFNAHPVIVLSNCNSAKVNELSFTLHEPRTNSYEEKITYSHLSEVTLDDLLDDNSNHINEAKIRITHVITPDEIFVVREKDVDKIEELNRAMLLVAKKLPTLDIMDLRAGSLCIISRQSFPARAGNEAPPSVVRAQVLSIENDGANVFVRHLDSGFEQKVEATDLLLIPHEEFFDSQKFPIFAVRCKLHNIIPNLSEQPLEVQSKGTWPRNSMAIKHLQYLTEVHRTMFATVTRTDVEKKITVVDIRMTKKYEPRSSYVSDFLVFMGSARFAEPCSRYSTSDVDVSRQYVSLSKDCLGKGQIHSVLLTSTSENRLDRIFFHVLSTKDEGSEQVSHSQALTKVYGSMETFYEKNRENGDIFIDCPRTGQPCVVYWKRGSKTTLLRGLITNVFPGQPSGINLPESPAVEVCLVDEGTVRVVSLREIRSLPLRFLRIPKLAVQARLSGIHPDSDSLRAYQEFVLACGGKPLLANVDQNQNVPEEVELTLYYKEKHKLININALLAFKGCAKLLNPTEPFFKRVEYMLDDPANLAAEFWPTHTCSNVGEDADLMKKLKPCRVVNFMLTTTGQVVVFVTTDDKAFEVTRASLSELQIKCRELKVEENKEWLVNETGMLCCVKMGSSWIRARVSKVTANEEVQEVLNIDTGEFITVPKDSPVLALYDDCKLHLDLVPIPLKLSGMKFKSETELKKFMGFVNLTSSPSVKFTETHEVDAYSSNLASVKWCDLIAGGESIPEIRLVFECSSAVTPFGKSILFSMDIALRAKELGFTPDISDYDLIHDFGLDDQTWLLSKAKLSWLDPVLPIHVNVNNYAMLREEEKDGSSPLFDFSGKVSYVDVDGSLFLEKDECVAQLVSLNSRIEAIYHESKSKLHDQFWYVGEPCIALFDWDSKWYRGTIAEIVDGNEHQDQAFYVKLVDYGNKFLCSKEYLRKDLIGVDVPSMVTRVVLDGVTFNELFDATQLHRTLVGQVVHVQLTQEPKSMPMVGNVFWATEEDQMINLKTLLAFQKYVSP